MSTKEFFLYSIYIGYTVICLEKKSCSMFKFQSTYASYISNFCTYHNAYPGSHFVYSELDEVLWFAFHAIWPDYIFSSSSAMGLH